MDDLHDAGPPESFEVPEIEEIPEVADEIPDVPEMDENPETQLDISEFNDVPEVPEQPVIDDDQITIHDPRHHPEVLPNSETEPISIPNPEGQKPRPPEGWQPGGPER